MCGKTRANLSQLKTKRSAPTEWTEQVYQFCWISLFRRGSLVFFKGGWRAMNILDWRLGKRVVNARRAFFSLPMIPRASLFLCLSFYLSLSRFRSLCEGTNCWVVLLVWEQHGGLHVATCAERFHRSARRSDGRWQMENTKWTTGFIQGIKYLTWGKKDINFMFGGLTAPKKLSIHVLLYKQRPPEKREAVAKAVQQWPRLKRYWKQKSRKLKAKTEMNSTIPHKSQVQLHMIMSMPITFTVMAASAGNTVHPSQMHVYFQGILMV